MTPLEALCDFTAVGRHFSSDYDYVKYHGKIQIKRNALDKRTQIEQRHFERIARHHDPHWLIVTNLVEEPRRWVGDVARGEEIYAKRKGVIETLNYNIQRALEELPIDSVYTELGVHPRLILGVLGGSVSMEVGAVIAAATNGFQWANSKDALLREVAQRLLKYELLIPYERAAIVPLIRSHFFLDSEEAISDK